MRLSISVAILACSVAAIGQPFQFEGRQDFLEFADPLITQGERELYDGLKTYSERDYFEAIFWFKRDPHPELPGNTYKRDYFARRESARKRFGEGSVPGPETARGRVYLLLGEPDRVEQNQITGNGAVRGYEETWFYDERGISFPFVLDLAGKSYRLKASPDLQRSLERMRLDQIRDRAQAYRLNPVTLALPNVGSSKDVENLVAIDKNEIDFTVSYAFFRGDLNKTQLVAGLTFHDASPRGLEVNLTAFDPYDNKVVDFKKKMEPENGEYRHFFVALEPDQYELVMRVRDKDGRDAVRRQRVDVPRLGFSGTASSVILADALLPIPLEGFFEPDIFVFDRQYLSVRNAFRQFRARRLFVMQHYYGATTVPATEFEVDGRAIQARLETSQTVDDVLKVVYSLPASEIAADARELALLHRVEDQVYAVSTVPLASDSDARHAQLASAEQVDFDWVAPTSSRIEALKSIAIRPDNDIETMTVFLNGTRILERRHAPWRLRIPEEAISISGENRIDVVVRDRAGRARTDDLEFVPLKADEEIKSRAVEVFFNAFDRDLNFVTDLDFSSLNVTVDDTAWKPMEVYRLDDPITYCFLVDTSFSMRESFSGNIRAVKKMIDSIRPKDGGYVVSFNDNYHQFNQPTRSKGVLNAVVDSLELQRPNPKYADKIYSENTTYLYDAVIATIHSLLQYPGRRVIVLVSDGIGTEGIYAINGMLNYARENDVVLYSLWLDNNPRLSDEEEAFITKEMGGGERIARKIGLSRFFADKDSQRNLIRSKVQKSSITQGILKLVAEESGGFHYRIFKADRSLIQAYVEDIESAVNSQFAMTLSLPISEDIHRVEIESTDDDIAIRAKSRVKVRKTNPLGGSE